MEIYCVKCKKKVNVDNRKIKKGKTSSLKYQGKVVGAVLRTKDKVRPVFVSPGHRIDLKASVEIVLGCITKYRIPEPLRRADSLSKKIKRAQ